MAEAARGEYVQAVGAFERACGLEPANLMYAYQLCVTSSAAARAGKKVAVRFPERTTSSAPADSQIRQLAQYVASEPDFVEAFLALPESDIDEELFGVLIPVLRTALAGHDNYADLHYLTSRMLMRIGQEQSAMRHASRAVEINPRYTKALVHLAGLHQRAGSAAVAVGLLNRAIDCGGDWPDVHAQLGDVYRRVGDDVRAGRHYRRALELNDHYTRAAHGLAAMAA